MNPFKQWQGQSAMEQQPTSRSNRLTYVDEIFTVYEDIKKVAKGFLSFSSLLLNPLLTSVAFPFPGRFSANLIFIHLTFRTERRIGLLWFTEDRCVSFVKGFVSLSRDFTVFLLALMVHGCSRCCQDRPRSLA